MEEAKRESSPQSSDDVEEEQSQSPTTNGGQANGATEDGQKESALLHNIKTKGKNAVRLSSLIIFSITTRMPPRISTRKARRSSRVTD